eukprot:9299307-Ditylum_brightwellii.AAC.1
MHDMPMPNITAAAFPSIANASVFPNIVNATAFPNVANAVAFLNVANAMAFPNFTNVLNYNTDQFFNFTVVPFMNGFNSGYQGQYGDPLPLPN